MSKAHGRNRRIAAELQRLLNDLLLFEVKDPRLAGVRVNDVELSGDSNVATVYFGTLEPDADPTHAIEAFDKAKGFFRSRAAEALRLRRTPELRFEHDTSARRAFEIERLIDSTRARDDSGGGSDMGSESGRDDGP
jgi:ribosome-binding factor A